MVRNFLSHLRDHGLNVIAAAFRIGIVGRAAQALGTSVAEVFCTTILRESSLFLCLDKSACGGSHACVERPGCDGRRLSRIVGRPGALRVWSRCIGSAPVSTSSTRPRFDPRRALF